MLEEAVLDDLAIDLDLLETPLGDKAFKLVGTFSFIIIAAIAVRILYLGVWQGNFYKNQALANAGKIIPIPAQRGIIYDRFNSPLVKNLPIFRLSLKIPDLLKLKKTEQEQIIKKISEILNISDSDIKNSIYSVNLEKQNSVVLTSELSQDEIIKFKNFNLEPIQIEENFKREYFDSKIFSHLVGYTGPVSKNDLKNSDFSLNHTIGKSGLENYYDEQLRGVEGKIIYYRDAKGRIIDNKFLKDARAGYEIQTTIDSEFQTYFYNRLNQGLENIGSESGAGIAINPKTGEILALISLPSYDTNKISPSVLIDSRKPLFNRITAGLYSPGSTIKPLVALAALKEGVIDAKTEIFSRGYIEIPNPYFPDQPSRFLDWKPHGWVNLYSAIARSSNIYFYALAGGLPDNELSLLRGLPSGKIQGLGIEKLKQYWQQFGFEEKTGIDLPGENVGFLPDPEKKENYIGAPWRLGDTYNVGIGQGDLIITPMELISYITGIANNGKFYRPFIAKKILSEKGEIISETNPQIIKDYSNDFSGYFEEIRKAMIDVVKKPYGSAYLLADLDIKIAAKTGTAQINNNKKTNAFFVGYAPADNPQIAILILIENSREGSLNTTPVAKDVLKWYYENRL